MNRRVRGSSFLSPVELWPQLATGSIVVFKEYDDSGIPPAYIALKGQDIVYGSECLGNVWKNYSVSMMGLEEALLDNADRLIEWHYMRWFGSLQFEQKLQIHYYSLVSQYKRFLQQDLTDYFGKIRIIEAGTTYSHFLHRETTLLACFKYGCIYDWQTSCKVWRNDTVNRPPCDKDPIDRIHNPDRQEFEGYIIERRRRFDSSGFRGTVVDVSDIQMVVPDDLVKWLKNDITVNYKGNSLFQPEECGFVFGTDSDGVDFVAGDISDPRGLVMSLQKEENPI